VSRTTSTARRGGVAQWVAHLTCNLILLQFVYHHLLWFSLFPMTKWV